jgi:hypothetical protein
MSVAINLENDSVAILERQWAEAMAAVARAQSEYFDLQRSAEADDRVEARAWLRLWKAERHQREVLAALEEIEN